MTTSGLQNIVFRQAHTNVSGLNTLSLIGDRVLTAHFKNNADLMY